MTQLDRMKIAVETKLTLSTVTKWDKGGRVSSSSAESIVRACDKLGIDLSTRVAVVVNGN